MIVSKEDAVGSIQGAVSKERMQLGRLQRGCQRHQTKVASHTAVPMGTAKWLVKMDHTSGTLPLGKEHTQHMSPTQRQAYIIGGNPIPAISQPLWGQLYGWLPLSNAYGISSVVSQSSNLTAEYAPDGGNEPPAQGNTLG